MKAPMPFRFYYAHMMQAFAESRGLPCHIRQWHNGEQGWFCVADATYNRIDNPNVVSLELHLCQKKAP